MGAKLCLEVAVDGNPTQVRWMKDGLPVDEGRCKLEDLGNGKYRLTIPEMGADDFRNYSVEVSNGAGKAESKARITEAGECLLMVCLFHKWVWE